MLGSVHSMAEWFSTPGGESLGSELPDGYAGDAVKVRPLSRLERMKYTNPILNAHPGATEDPPELIEKMLELGIVDWTFDDELTTSNKTGLDDVTVLVAYAKIAELSFRSPGEANGSEAPSLTEPKPKNSRKRSM